MYALHKKQPGYSAASSKQQNNEAGTITLVGKRAQHNMH
jgi:hypothetical protein